MKGILLAAGLGTRLRPITESLPKCLVPIDGIPLLGWWFRLLEREGVTDLLINLHHHPNQVTEYIEGYGGDLRIATSYEPELLGSAGTIRANRDFFDPAEQFFILYGDNLTNVRLRSLAEHSRRFPAALTVGLFHAPDPGACGIAELEPGEEGRIVSFVEKPQRPVSDLASAGIFVGRSRLFDYLDPEATLPYDFGRDVMPRLAGSMNGLPVEGYLRDVGTHESLGRAQEEWTGINTR